MQGALLSSRLEELENGAVDFWTFNGRDERAGAHALFHYPAMMVPRMQGAILDVLKEFVPSRARVLDPFVGSGTTLVESMARGFDFTGVDINPLAVLVSKVKATILNPEYVSSRCAGMISAAKTDSGRSYFVAFENRAKWFSNGATIALSKIARAIEREEDVRVRRVFWVIFARVVRYVCNSRRSTYKLHIKESIEVVSGADVFREFDLHSKAVLEALANHYEIIDASGGIVCDRYSGCVEVYVKDILKFEPSREKADIIITSPPYGDNRTTVPYGQYSYLSLQWIPLRDIEDDLDRKVIANTHATDTASLGGSLINALERAGECIDHDSYLSTLKKLNASKEAQKRFASFSADLKMSIKKLSSHASPTAFHVWTVGGRRIAGVQVPMALLVSEMLASENIHVLHSATRRILSKRMASRNMLGDTMDVEQILIAQRAVA